VWARYRQALAERALEEAYIQAEGEAR
jgi:hypothetical protein